MKKPQPEGAAASITNDDDLMKVPNINAEALPNTTLMMAHIAAWTQQYHWL